VPKKFDQKAETFCAQAFGSSNLPPSDFRRKLLDLADKAKLLAFFVHWPVANDSSFASMLKVDASTLTSLSLGVNKDEKEPKNLLAMLDLAALLLHGNNVPTVRCVEQ
jgi:hypothetical protein